MSRAVVLVACIVGTFSIMVPAGPAAAATGYHKCDGRYRTQTDLILRSISARKVSCSTARRVIGEVGAALDNYETIRRTKVQDFSARTWTCSIRTAYTRDRNPYGAGTCTLRGGRRVKFAGYS